jgi:hypothetical protein
MDSLPSVLWCVTPNNAIAVIEFMQNSLQVQNEVQMTGLNDALFTAEIAKAWFCPSYMGGDDAE